METQRVEASDSDSAMMGSAGGSHDTLDPVVGVVGLRRARNRVPTHAAATLRPEDDRQKYSNRSGDSRRPNRGQLRPHTSGRSDR